MKGLLIKDFNLLKGQKQFFLVALAFAFLFLFLTDQYSFGIAYLIVMIVSFTVSTIAYDEYDNGNPFLFTLPVSRRGYVMEKYLFCLLTALGGCVLNLALIVVLRFVKSESGANVEILLLTLGGALIAGILMMAIVVPLQLKFGSEKRQMAMIVGFVAFFAMIYCGKSLIDELGLPGFVTGLRNISMELAIILTVILVIVLVFISYLVSVRIMEKKEF